MDQKRHQKLIVFNQKPQWIHKKHNTTLVGEKRWRFEEGFGADEVIFSALSRDQYYRRKKISASLFANLDGACGDTEAGSSSSPSSDKPSETSSYRRPLSPYVSKKLDKFMMTDGVKKQYVIEPL